MAVTSANLSGQPSPSTAQEVFGQLGGRIALIIDGGKTPGGVPSTVVDCSGMELQILREGPISKDEIRAVLGSASNLAFNSLSCPVHLGAYNKHCILLLNTDPPDLGQSSTGFVI